MSNLIGLLFQTFVPACFQKGATWEAQFPFQFKFQLYDELEFCSIRQYFKNMAILNSAYHTE